MPVPVALGALGLLLGKILLDLLNARPEDRVETNIQNQDFILPGTGNRTIVVSWRVNRTNDPTLLCSNGSQVAAGAFNQGAPESITFSGTGVRVGATSGRQTTSCGSGTNVPAAQVMALQQLTAAGPGPVIRELQNGPFRFDPFISGGLTDSLVDLQWTSGGLTYRNETITPNDFGPGIKPQVTGDLPEPEPAPSPITPPQRRPPLPLAPPSAPPIRQPSPSTPGGLPGGSPSPSRVPVPLLPPAPATPNLPTDQKAVPITAGGVRPQLPPATQPTAPGTTFLPSGRPLAPNGPAPNMVAIAQELGKLEQKLEIVLNPDDSLSPLELLNRVVDQIENIEFLIERLFPPPPYTFGPGSYQLAPICDRDSEGNLIEPLEAPWAGGEGEFTELRQRLDALAQLIQHHKTLKQPTCGPRGSGPHSNVTVHFESD